MNIKKGDCEICGGFVGILNNFNLDNNHKILCGKCHWEMTHGEKWRPVE